MNVRVSARAERDDWCDDLRASERYCWNRRTHFWRLLWGSGYDLWVRARLVVWFDVLAHDL